MNTFAERLKHARDKANLSQQELAKLVGLGQSAIAMIENGNRNTSRAIAEIAEALNVNEKWLRKGEGEMKQGVLSLQNHDESYSDDKSLIVVKKWSATAGMGNGVPAELEHDEVIGHLGVTRNWAMRYLHKAQSFNTVELITGLGDSMSPTYSDGETLFIDRSITEMKLDAVYAFKYDNELYIKRIQRQKGRLKVISDNPSYDAWYIEPDELERVRVIGRIIHGCRIYDI